LNIRKCGNVLDVPKSQNCTSPANATSTLTASTI
jgi:hypothetical protein